MSERKLHTMSDQVTARFREKPECGMAIAADSAAGCET